MCTLKRSSPQADAQDCFVLGTESAALFVVDSHAFTVLSELQLRAGAPTHLHASGLFDVEFRLVGELPDHRLLIVAIRACPSAVCTRDGKVFSVKRGATVADRPLVQLDSCVVGMTKVQKTIVVGCMDETLRGYSLKGRRVWTLTVSTLRLAVRRNSCPPQMPCAIATVDLLDYKPRNYLAALVGLKNGEVRVYKNTFLLDCIRLTDCPSALRFGPLGAQWRSDLPDQVEFRSGREEGGLAVVTRAGGLYLKLFKRTAKLEEKSATVGPPAAQGQKLNVPKKTRVFVELTGRERDQAREMHRNHQRQFFLLR